MPAEKIRLALSDIGEPQRAVRELVALANGSGGPDNVSCVVAADVSEVSRGSDAAAQARV